MMDQIKICSFGCGGCCGRIDKNKAKRKKAIKQEKASIRRKIISTKDINDKPNDNRLG